ncbi:hypothetical protein [Halomonas sp. CKK8]|uniref:hypothetical protein n=1 Tax=Halomonas sp. CKK8 TaxID=3036127 RepID=UPI00241570DC|nr:hypothetical protein [Halomonas sp. CKK8]WFM72963.1 hypothetical protein P8934_08195 [Halomonas sp. CKK8]
METEPNAFYAIGQMAGWWLIFLVVVPWLAVLLAVYSRGNSMIVAGFIGFFGTPLIGMLYVIAQPVNQSVLDERAIRSGKSRRCSKCMTLKHPTARICPQCKTIAGKSDAQEPSRLEPSLSGMSAVDVPGENVERAEPDENASAEFRRRMQQRDP